MKDVDKQEPRELDILAQLINEGHRACVSEQKKTVEHGIKTVHYAIYTGELLAEAKAQCKHGDWLPWIENNFEGSVRTAQVYMQLYSNRDEIRGNAQSSAHLSISGALKEISAPREEDQENDIDGLHTQREPDELEKKRDELDITAEELEGRNRVARADSSQATPALVALPSGKEVSPQEAAKYYQEFLKNLNEEKAKAEKATKDADKAKANAKKREERADKKLKEEQAKVHADFREAVQSNYQTQLAVFHARYDIQETPTIFEVDPEAFKKAVTEAQNTREKEILDILSGFFPVVSSMRKFEPTEAARGALKWPSEERAKEAIRETGEWLLSMAKEMEAMTTPGVLRGIQGGK